ncbi:sugar phosphate isomerase/epimerase family protein [Pseudarthrobacter oxydans]|uniref:sugar phosphate isomerase/epimerase family protein n=1 Tax=Pseudarthrobacter oxydans TaxID=1671 RepID=UPI0029381AE4|nr:sugar phosphate isomerase/epimerase family protein [Actinomycetes bacterium ARC8]
MTATMRLCGIADEGAASFNDQINMHARLGVDLIELRSFDDRRLDHYNDTHHEEWAAQLKDTGLTVPVVDSPIGSWAYDIGRSQEEDLAHLTRYIRIAQIYDCQQIRVMSYPNDGRAESAWRTAVIERFRLLTQLASEAGVTLLLENCDGWAGQSAANTLDLLAEVSSSALSLLFDTGNGVTYGYDSLEFLQLVAPHVSHVHLKDSLDSGTVRFVPLGTGASRITECLVLLRDSGYNGVLSVEPHIDRLPHAGTRNSDALLRHSYCEYMRRAADLIACTQDGTALNVY